jgi:hypothetical protein
MTTPWLLSTRSAPAVAVCSVLCCLIGPRAFGIEAAARGEFEDTVIFMERDTASSARATARQCAAPVVRLSTALTRCVPSRRDPSDVGIHDRPPRVRGACRGRLDAAAGTQPGC